MCCNSISSATALEHTSQNKDLSSTCFWTNFRRSVNSFFNTSRASCFFFFKAFCAWNWTTCRCPGNFQKWIIFSKYDNWIQINRSPYGLFIIIDLSSSTTWSAVVPRKSVLLVASLASGCIVFPLAELAYFVVEPDRSLPCVWMVFLPAQWKIDGTAFGTSLVFHKSDRIKWSSHIFMFSL